MALIPYIPARAVFALTPYRKGQREKYGRLTFFWNVCRWQSVVTPLLGDLVNDLDLDLVHINVNLLVHHHLVTQKERYEGTLRQFLECVSVAGCSYRISDPIKTCLDGALTPPPSPQRHSKSWDKNSKRLENEGRGKLGRKNTRKGRISIRLTKVRKSNVHWVSLVAKSTHMPRKPVWHFCESVAC